MAAGSGSESGRSLVEMLGTLAIMGILTIGGIVGFNYAMNKQRANATVNYVNQLAVLGTGQMPAGLGNRYICGEKSWGPYCNRRNGGGYSFPCEKGTIGVSAQGQTYPTPDGQATAQRSECIPCAQVDISRLKYQAWCESCGGKWVGKAWDKGTCHTP